MLALNIYDSITSKFDYVCGWGNMSRTLGHYSIKGEIGRGGMAVVYSAVQESLNRVVALKELDLSRFRSEPTVLERFRLEARSAAALDHPNIITIYDLWEDGDKVYIAMEHIDGVELKDVLVRHGAMEFVSAIHVALETCAALHYAHGRGMVHRDVKPGNIMLSRKGGVRLMDFGIVSVSGTGDLTVTGQILGTPAYMSPEQIAGENLGPGADIFSLGVVIYEMLTGRRPFSGDNQLALIQQIMNRQPIPPRDIVPEMPQFLSNAVLQCLEKDPGNRFPSMENLAAELQRSLYPGARSREECIAHLVAQTSSQKSPGFGIKDSSGKRTSIYCPMQGVKTEYVDERAVTGGTGTVVSETGNEEPSLTLTQNEYSPYDLEADPPADLPPLDLSGSGTSDEAEPIPVVEEQEIPLSLKELPSDEPEDVPKAARGLKWRYLLLGLIPVLLIAGVAIWKFSGVTIPSASTMQGVLTGKVKQPSGPTLLMVFAEPGTSIIMDGEPLGEVNDSSIFEVKPGLHKVEAVNQRLGVKSFIVEIEPGGMKEIRVRWEEGREQ
jgi:serine/threonine protein kinase